MNKNGLYQVKQYYWFLYPTNRAAHLGATAGVTGAATATIRTPGPTTPGDAAHYAAHWSKEFNCNVTYLSPNTILFPVEIHEKFIKVISTEGIGWMIVADWAKECFEEVKE